MTRRLDATARVVAEAGPRGTVLTELRGGGPIALRRTDPGVIHLVGAAAGPLGGDRWRVEVCVGAGATLRVRSAAASIALPGPDGAASRLEVVATVAAGAVLDWAPEPLVAAAGARHTSYARVDLAAGAGLRWREELACGRYGEEPGSVRSFLTVSHAGLPLLVHDLATGPDAPGHASPAVLGDARAAGTLLLAGTCCPPGAGGADSCGENFATMRLAGPGLLVTAVAEDALAVRRMLTERDDPTNV